MASESASVSSPPDRRCESEKWSRLFNGLIHLKASDARGGRGCAIYKIDGNFSADSVVSQLIYGRNQVFQPPLRKVSKSRKRTNKVPLYAFAVSLLASAICEMVKGYMASDDLNEFDELHLLGLAIKGKKDIVETFLIVFQHCAT